LIWKFVHRIDPTNPFPVSRSIPIFRESEGRLAEYGVIGITDYQFSRKRANFAEGAKKLDEALGIRTPLPFVIKL
jgi:hypothetical protein